MQIRFSPLNMMILTSLFSKEKTDRMNSEENGENYEIFYSTFRSEYPFFL